MKGWVIIVLGLILVSFFYALLIVGGFFKIKPYRAKMVGEGVFVSVDKNWYETNESITITFTNNLSNAVFLDGCRPYVIEGRPVKDGRIISDWAVVWAQNCKIEKIAYKVKPYTSIDFTMPAFNFEGELRVSVDYYEGCDSGKSISYSHCKNTSTVRSESFIIIT
ncbi:hypothetical protein DRN74_02380 [Candidatus Micrarchaeota archaeon]|nr:MAG: hypothetical protein DRN74_02380 [Candidatus Micrarchaeota archaeon]